jgi:hypothetical protein
MEKLDSILKIDAVPGLSLREKFEQLRMFLVDIVGEDATNEILGSDTLEEVDLCDITITVRKIVDAYDKPLIDYNNKKSKDALNQIPFDKISQLAKVTADMPKNND